MNEIDDNFGNWLAGFTDGERCFRISKWNKNKRNPSACYGCQFKIGLRNDDRPILEEIRDTLGIGFIRDQVANTYGGHNNQALAIFQVYTTAECVKLVKLFKKYPLRAKKQHDFLVWKEAVKELQKPIACRSPDKLEYYFLKIKQVRQYEVQDDLEKPAPRSGIPQGGTIKELQITIKF